MKKILLVDDDKLFLSFGAALLGDEFQITTASSVQMAKVILRQEKIDVAVIDLHFEGHVQDGIDLLSEIQEEFSHIPVIVMSGDQNTSRVVDAMKRPIVEFVVKDGDHDTQLRSAIKKALVLRGNLNKSKKVIYQSASSKLQKMVSEIEKVLDTPQEKSILILGETGTGKEYIAKHISQYLNKKMISVNMANINKEMAESILFGHKKGAFTGAMSDHIGLLEKAHNGILFLDEIGECSLEVQAKILRVLQDREITPLGSTQSKTISTHFVTATHKDLYKMTEVGLFRLDLLQRLSTFEFHIPALRNRVEDIEYYAHLFLSELSRGEIFNIQPCGLDILNNYEWKGNIRELKNVIQRAIVYSPNRTLDKNVVLKALGIERAPVSIDLKLHNIPERLKTDNKKDVILGVLDSVDGNRTEAAKILNVNPSTLYRWIQKYGLSDIATPVIWGRPTAI